MKAAIYNPYLDSLGGGERYAISVAKAFSDIGYKVNIQWKNDQIKPRLEKRFGIDLAGIDFIENINKGDGYDICFWVSDGSIPLLHSRFNILHFQIPFANVNGKTLLNKMKLIRINKIVCNSKFTKKIIDEEFGLNSIVIYPPVPVAEIKSRKKENIILFVGRFSQLKQVKHQDILIDYFKKFFDKYSPDWRLILAGGSEVGSEEYVGFLRKKAEGYPISIQESPSFSQIKELYGKAKIFWTASGFGVDPAQEPDKVEHFGIALVESMAAGCIPFAYKAGGHEEIITHGVNGFLWEDGKQLLSYFLALINDSKKLKEISNKAKVDSKIYEYERFAKQFQALVVKR